MRKVALLPGLDGTGKLYQPLITQLSEFDCHVYIYPHALIEPKEIAKYLVDKHDFSKLDILVAESFGCRVLYELFQLAEINNAPSVFIAGFSSISTRYKLLAQGPDFLLKTFYQKAAKRFALKRYCLGNTKDENLINLLQEVLTSLPYKTVIGRLRFLAKYPFNKTDANLSSSKFILAKADKLLSQVQQHGFASEIGAKEIIELDAPHFIAQTNALEVAQIIRKSLKA